MNLTNPEILKSFLARYHIRPNDRLGQNFLISQDALATIAQSAKLESHDVVLEIGAGVGTLTQALAESCKLVVAYELDRKLLKALRAVIGERQNVQIVQGDFLRVDEAVLASMSQAGGYKVVANIPYYITGEIIRKLLTSVNRPRMLVILVQREVAERICARPGDMSLLGLSVQYYGLPEIVGNVSKTAFFPQPEVDSSIVRITVHQTPPDLSDKEFFRIARMGFSSKRKTLSNTLSAGLRISKSEIDPHLIALGIRPAQRAQELSVAQWEKLTQALDAFF